MTEIKVAIIDDHAILRQGLKLLLSEMQNMKVVIEAANGKEFIEQLNATTTQLAIVEINMPVMKGD